MSFRHFPGEKKENHGGELTSRLRLESRVFRIRNKFAAHSIATFQLSQKCWKFINFDTADWCIIVQIEVQNKSYEIHIFFNFPCLGKGHSFVSHYAMRLVPASSKLDPPTEAKSTTTCFVRKLSRHLQVISS